MPWDMGMIPYGWFLTCERGSLLVILINSTYVRFSGNDLFSNGSSYDNNEQLLGYSVLEFQAHMSPHSYCFDVIEYYEEYKDGFFGYLLKKYDFQNILLLF